MAVVAACRQLELMRQTVAEEAGGTRLPAPGLVVVITHADGRMDRIAPPLPAPPLQIEADAERLPEMEP
jgi:hypothetical protein